MPATVLSSQNIYSYLPENAVGYVSALLVNNPLKIKISRKRSSKLGDFKVLAPFHKPEISVNGNLNKYEFLITFLHEYAHFMHWKEFPFSRKPHGKKWKQHFSKLLLPVMTLQIFPEEILTPLESFILNPLATGNTHISLTKALHKHNPSSPLVSLDELPEKTLFSLGKNKIFEKGILQRKRYKCLCKTNGKSYFVNASILVLPIQASNI